MCLIHTSTKKEILLHWYIQYSHVYKSLWSKLGRSDADWLAALHLARLTNAAPGFQIFVMKSLFALLKEELFTFVLPTFV